MNPIDFKEIMMWGAVMALVVLVTYTGACINRFFVHRAHRRALAELQSHALRMHRKADNSDLSVAPRHIH